MKKHEFPDCPCPSETLCWAREAAEERASASVAGAGEALSLPKLLTDEEIDEAYYGGDLQPQLYEKRDMFAAGISFAERHYGLKEQS